MIEHIPRQPRQPSNLEVEDRDDLAVLGHRIEIWNEARTGGRPFRERLDTLAQKLEGEVARVPGQASVVELQLIEEELRFVDNFDGTEDEFNEYCQEQENYYTEVRAQTIRNLNQTNGGTLPEA